MWNVIISSMLAANEFPVRLCSLSTASILTCPIPSLSIFFDSSSLSPYTIQNTHAPCVVIHLSLSLLFVYYIRYSNIWCAEKHTKISNYSIWICKYNIWWCMSGLSACECVSFSQNIAEIYPFEADSMRCGHIRRSNFANFSGACLNESAKRIGIRVSESLCRISR